MGHRAYEDTGTPAAGQGKVWASEGWEVGPHQHCLISADLGGGAIRAALGGGAIHAPPPGQH